MDVFVDEGVQTRPSLTGCNINAEHSLSMTWREWDQVIRIYLKYLKLFIISGNHVVLPHNTGVMQLHKSKYKQTIDWGRYNKTKEYTFFKNNHTNGFRVSFRWYRNKYDASIKDRFLWAGILLRPFRKEISTAIKNDNLLLNSYSTPSYSRNSTKEIKT